MTPEPSPQVLDDLLVVELASEETQYCGQLLAELGARVILVEPPEGAPCRHRGPYKDDVVDVNASLYFWAFNTSKASVTLDLGSPLDRRRVAELAARADVFLEGTRPGTLGALGLDHERLAAHNPGLITTSITPFGQTGPRAGWAGADIVYWATGGLMAGAGYGDEGSPPLCPQGDLSFIVGGNSAFVATLAALLARDTTGDGQHVDVSIHEACAFLERGGLPLAAGGPDARTPRGRGGYALRLGQVRCRDGRYVIPMTTYTGPAAWAKLVAWFREHGVGEHLWDLDLEELAQTTPSDVNPFPRFVETLEEIATGYTAAELCAVGQSMGFTFMAYNAPDELLDDEQLAARGFFQSVHHPEHGATYTYAGEPYRFSTAGWRIRSRAPLLGEHNAALDELLG